MNKIFVYFLFFSLLNYFYPNQSFSNELLNTESEDKLLNRNLVLDALFILSKKVLKSSNNKDIEVYKIGTGNYKIAFIGTIHGDEPQGNFIIRKLIDEILFDKNLVIDKSLLLIPLANPDGLLKRSRVNLNGVDINRNFPTKDWKKSNIKNRYYSGNYPNSELETKILIEEITNFDPNIIITIHSPYKVINYDSDGIEIANLLSKYNNYRVVSNIGYKTLGSLGTYFGKERNIPVITIETPQCTNEKAWSENKNALKNFLYHY